MPIRSRFEMHFAKALCCCLLPVCAAVFFLACLLDARPAAAQSYYPDHPKVVQLVDRGVAFLRDYRTPSSTGEYGGAPILVAYTLLKATGDPDDRLVVAGVASAVRLARSLANNSRREYDGKIVYEASVAAVLLANFDAGKYGAELEMIAQWLVSVQKPHGGFGYLERPTGDTSQVQYAVLAMWILHEVGVDVPVATVEDTIEYLKSTMDPSGGWGYQGKPSVGRLVAQEGVTKSLSTAGAGALIICGDILGFYGQRRTAAEEEDGIPAAFVRIDIRNRIVAERRRATLSRGDIDGQFATAQRYQTNTRFGSPTTSWYYYWRYSQERYESFVEIAENKQNKSPAWYNEGVDELARLQQADGSWPTNQTPTDVSTSFAILFLIRSTQKAIGQLDEGIAFGGYGLPTDVSSVKIVGNRIVSEAEMSMESLLGMLEADTAGDVESGLIPRDMQLSPDPVQRRQQVSRLARLLSSEDPEARQIAAKLLGRSDDLNQVPELIYALTDPNDKVPMIAEESLRLLSRKLTSRNLQQNPTDAQRRAAVEFWKNWYLGLRPDYIFIDR